MGLLGKIMVKLGLDSSEFQKGTKDAGSTAESFGDKIRGMAVKAAAAIGVLELLRKAFNIGKEAYNTAAQAEGVKRAFDKLNNPNLLNNLREATQNTVSDLELMQNAIQAKNFKIPLDNLATYLKFATTRAKETRQSVDYLVQSIVLGVGRKSPLILDNLGISALEVREEFAKTGDMAKAVANIIEREMGDANDTVVGSKEKIGQASAAWGNALSETGKSDFIKNIGDAFYNASAAIAENLQRIIPIVRDVIVGYVAYKATVIALSIAEKARLVATLSGEVALSIATKGVTYWKGIQYALTLNLKKAQEALNIAMAKNPYGLIAMGIATAVFAISRLISAIGEETEAEKELREEQERKLQRSNGYLQSMAKEQTQVDILFGKLKSLKVGTSEYNDVKETIISRYGQYLKGLGDEITSLRDIEAAYKAISASAVQAARDRALESATSEAAGKYATSEAAKLTSIRKLILEKNKGIAGETIFESLKQSIRLGEEYSDEVKKAIGYTKEWGQETTVIADRVVKRMPNIYETLIDGIKTSKKELDAETKEIEQILGGVYKAKTGKTYTTLSELTADLSKYQAELNKLNSQTSWSNEEQGRIAELNTNINELTEKYKAFTGKEFGAKVKVEADKDKTKAALEGSIAYFENLLSEAQLELKFAVTDEQRAKAQAKIKGIQAEIDVRVNIPDIKSERQVLEDAIKGYEELQIAIPIGMGSLEEIAAAQEEFDRLQGFIKQARAELEKFPKAAKEMFPAGSMADFDQQIADIDEKIKTLTGSELAAAQAARAMLEVRKEGAASGWQTQLEKEVAWLNTLKLALESATEAEKNFIQEQINMQQEVIDNLDKTEERVVDFGAQLSSQLGSAIASSLGTMFDALFSGDEEKTAEEKTQAILQPFADMIVQLGEYTLAMGLAGVAIKALMKNPWLAIAAGVTLIALGKVAQAGVQNITNGKGGGGNSDTFSGGYSNGGSNRTAQSLQLVSPQSQVVVLETRVSGSDIIFATDKENQRRKR